MAVYIARQVIISRPDNQLSVTMLAVVVKNEDLGICGQTDRVMSTEVKRK